MAVMSVVGAWIVVGKWNGDVAKSIFYVCRGGGSRRLSKINGKCTFFAGLESNWHSVRFSNWLDHFYVSQLFKKPFLNIFFNGISTIAI